MVVLERLVFIVLNSFLFSSLCAEALFFDSYLSHVRNKPKEFAVIGERCSGTNFIEALVLQNVPSLSSLYKNQKIGKRKAVLHKHFFPWLDLTCFGSPLISYTEKLFWIPSYRDTLFIFVVRNPYDWIRSFYQNPWHVDLQRMGLDERKTLFSFLSNEWHVLEKFSPIDEYLAHLSDNWNPYRERYFRNVLELRTYKILNALRLGQIVPNFIFVPYEKVLQDPKGFINWLSWISHHEAVEPFASIDTYKGVQSNASFSPQNYSPFRAHELDFIEKNLDWEVESWIGYEKNEVSIAESHQE